MAEPYVDEVIQIVDKNIPYRDGSKFWIWLGGVRYRDANGNLTPELAREIGENVRQLYAEWQEYEGTRNKEEEHRQ